jgi:hypothetical protein
MKKLLLAVLFIFIATTVLIAENHYICGKIEKVEYFNPGVFSENITLVYFKGKKFPYKMKKFRTFTCENVCIEYTNYKIAYKYVITCQNK